MTGNVRAAISWEINKWVHLSDWNWKVQLTVGVRFGAGKDRVQRALGNPQITTDHRTHDRIPLWITDYFWSPK